MTGAVCPSPGIARRADNYDEQVRRVKTCAPNPALNRLMVDKALALGTGDELTSQERCLMMALLAHLDIGGVAEGKTAVWPGSRRLCALLGLGESTLRRLKGSLEEKGYLLRRYDRCNRPLRGGALDLSPFLSKVEDLCGKIGHTDSRVAELQAADRTERSDHRSIMSAGALTSEPPIEETLQQDISERRVTSKGEGEGKADAASPEAMAAETLIPGIRQARQETAASILGEKKAQRLWHWADKRHGEAALLALAVAGTDPKIKDPGAWFAWFATSAAEVDLASIADRIIAARPRLLPLLEATGLHRQLIEAFSKEAGEGAARSYLAAASVEAREGTLRISLRSPTAKGRLEDRHAEALRRAARRLGYEGFDLTAGQPPSASA